MSISGETDDANGDGVWSSDIEEAFQEALKLFPPCGRRKHILQEEGGGKMYGRNELIARHIYVRTGKIRTRKQVSSHIQVLARRRAKDDTGGGGSTCTRNGSSGDGDSVSPASSMGANSAGLSSRPDSASMNGSTGQLNGLGSQLVPMDVQSNASATANLVTSRQIWPTLPSAASNGIQLDQFAWADRPIVTQKIRLAEFSAFVEHRQLSASINTNHHQNNSQAALASQAAVFAAAAAATSLAGGANGVESTRAYVPPLAPHDGTVINHHLRHSNASQLANTFASTTNHFNTHHPHSNHHHQSNHLSTQFSPTVGAAAAAYSNLNQHHQHRQSAAAAAADMLLTTSSTNQHQQQTPAGFTRHSYVKIDYRQPSGRQANKLERIDIRVIQDKFPELGGPQGLFQRGSSDVFYLVKFWADLNYEQDFNHYEDQNSYFGFSSQFETLAPFSEITCSTKACSYGLQVVEKVEKVYCGYKNANGTYLYDINRSPMCEFMIHFIKKLRQLPELTLMNSVLENFTILQVVTSETGEILLCLAFVFEIALPKQNPGSHYHVYKLSRD